MNFKRLTIAELADFEAMRFAKESLPERIKAERYKLNNIRTSLASVGCGRGNDCRKTEDEYISILARITMMEQTLSATTIHCKRIEDVLVRLTDAERMIVEEFFIYHNPEALEVCCSKLYVSKTTVYRWREMALKKCAVALWGCDDLRYFPKVFAEGFESDDEDIA